MDKPHYTPSASNGEGHILTVDQMQALETSQAQRALIAQLCEVQRSAQVATNGRYRATYSTEHDVNAFIREYLTPKGIMIQIEALDGGREVIEVGKWNKHKQESWTELHNRVWGRFKFTITDGIAEISCISYGDWVQMNELPNFTAAQTNAWRHFVLKTFALVGSEESDPPIRQPARARQKSKPKPSTAPRAMSNTEPTVSSQQISALAKALKVAGFGTSEHDKTLGRSLLGWLAECEPVEDIRDMPRACAERALERIRGGDINELVEQWNIARVAAEAAKAGERIDAALGTGIQE